MDLKAAKRPALGRGLGALIPGGSPNERKGVLMLGIEEIHPDRHQPRKHFDEERVAELAESIKSKGILQPVLVRRGAEGYVIIAGERRWRAAQKAGLREIPALVREISENDAFELALIENIQRQDLNPLEEAEAYQRLLHEHALTQEELAQRVGKDRTTITNSLRLLRLPDAVKAAVLNGQLGMGHARALLAIGDEDDLRRAADKVVHDGLTVRATEQLAQKLKQKKTGGGPRAAAQGAGVKDIVQKLQRRLGTKVELKDRGGVGTLEIRYGSRDELDRVVAVLLGDA